ncbi:MAG: hypothetical protein KC657_10795 [Myxococcales bacterium]|nr:hypothetical protein [Myxococcales bacterium]
MYLVRRINLDRWEPVDGFPSPEVPAELLFSEFRAKGNSLSLWTATDDVQQLEETALAIVSAFSKLETFDLVWFPQGDLQAAKVELTHTDGHTRIESLKKRHVDAARLDAYRLAHVAHAVATAVAAQRYRRFTKAEAADLLLSATEKGAVGASSLPKDLQNEIEAARERRSTSTEGR